MKKIRPFAFFIEKNRYKKEKLNNKTKRTDKNYRHNGE